MSPRSPWFPLVCGTALLVLSVLVRLAGANLVSAALLTLSLPLLFEGSAWFGASKVGGYYYPQLNERAIHSEAYDFRALLLRYAVICTLLFSILIARETALSLGSFSNWLIVILTGVLWLAFVLRSYALQIAALARKSVPVSTHQDRS